MKTVYYLISALIFVYACTGLQNAESFFKYGNDKYQLGYNYEALDAYDKAIKMKPDFYQAYLNRGNVKSKMGDKRGAIVDYSMAVKINPEFYDAYYSRGNRKFELNEKVEACKDWKKAADNGHKEAGNSYQKYCK